ncbi:hypothetical protein BG000_001275 [Podila horticola]|nr:hypothetical protein BG000_001275 [Podila horticola]
MQRDIFVGTFTKVVWRTAKEVGCATAKCESESVATPLSLAICRYSPIGNPGEFKDNVHKPEAK